MTDTLSNVTLAKGVWVNLYDTTGITVGTQIYVQNLTTSHVRIVASATQPTSDTGFNTLPPFKTALNDPGDDGAWALSTSGGAVNVREKV